MTPFEALKQIQEPGGNPRFLDIDQNVIDYAKNVFMINRGLAQSIDTIMFASEVNKRIIVDSEMHFGFLFNSIKKRKRWSAWAKKVDDSEALKQVVEFYQVNREVALDYMNVLTPEQLQEIADSFDPGGCKAPSKKK